MRALGEYIQTQKLYNKAHLITNARSNFSSYPTTCANKVNTSGTFIGKVNGLFQHPSYCRSLPKKVTNVNIEYNSIGSFPSSQDIVNKYSIREENKANKKTTSRLHGGRIVLERIGDEDLPKTGVSLPMEFPFNFSKQAPMITNNKLGPIVSSTHIQSCQKTELERLANFENGTSIRRLVFDLFEKRSGEVYAIDTSFPSYSLICSGKGMPPKTHTKQTKYFKAPLRPFYELQAPADNTLIFESRFELGNLRRAIQV